MIVDNHLIENQIEIKLIKINFPPQAYHQNEKVKITFTTGANNFETMMSRKIKNNLINFYGQTIPVPFQNSPICVKVQGEDQINNSSCSCLGQIQIPVVDLKRLNGKFQNFELKHENFVLALHLRKGGLESSYNQSQNILQIDVPQIQDREIIGRFKQYTPKNMIEYAQKQEVYSEKVDESPERKQLMKKKGRKINNIQLDIIYNKSLEKKSSQLTENSSKESSEIKQERKRSKSVTSFKNQKNKSEKPKSTISKYRRSKWQVNAFYLLWTVTIGTLGGISSIINQY